MLIDTVEVILKAGKGGSGITSFGKNVRSGPDGGNGGKGGNLYVVAKSDLTLLNQFSSKTLIEAESGQPGKKKKMSGLNGKDLEVFLPFGTSILDKKTNKIIYELDSIGERKIICFGGEGGKGNWEFRSSTKQTPKYHQPGFLGEEKKVILSLKLIADFGLIGLPNSGKSSLLNELTNAHAKTADYPFTTLSPNLGVLEKKFLADIPGLIEGASQGKGLGIKFLKHIEKVGVILHCISSESNDLIKDYEIVRSEIGKYSEKLLKKTEVILLTKSDLVSEKKIKTYIKKLKTISKKVIAVSIHNWESLEELKNFIIKYPKTS